MRKLLSVIALTAVIGTAWASDLPNVRILAVGGTIAGTAASSTQASYKAGQLGVETLIAAVPEIKNVADVKGEQFLNIGSGNLTDDNILALAKRVNEVAADASTDAIVITHGTDTLEETAWFLNLTAKTTKPIVMVGAMRPATAISADGPANLLDAVRCAADSQSVGKGVMIVMNNEIHNARDVTKMDVTEVSAFQAPTAGAIGRIAAGKVVYFKSSTRPHTAQSEFDVSKIDKLPRVDIIYSHLGDDGVLAQAAIKSGAKGIVNADVANSLYAGINTDTGGLSHNSSRPETYRLVAELLEAGLDKAFVHEHLYQMNRLSRLRLLGYALLAKLKVTENYSLAIISLSKNELERFRFRDGDLEGLVNVPLTVRDVIVSVLVTERKDKVKLSFRSKGEVPVSEWTKRWFNGGGHLNAAGGQMELPLEEVVKLVEETAPVFFKEYAGIVKE